MCPTRADLFISERHRRLFLEWFKRWGNVTTWHNGKPTNPKKTGPKRILENYCRKGAPSVISPVRNGLTHLAWIDIDAHAPTNLIQQADNYALAWGMYEKLTKLGLHPEWACTSNRFGSYHIYIWFSKPQSVSYVQNVLQGFVDSFHSQSKIEIGPMQGRMIRPYFFSIPPLGKVEGSCLIQGKVDEDISALRDYYQNQSTERDSCTNKDAKKLELVNYIPAKCDRHQKLLKLVQDAKLAGYSNEEIINLATEMHAKGTCKTSLKDHLKECDKMLKAWIPNPNRGIWSKLWNELPSGLTNEELLIRLNEYAKINNLKLIPISSVALSKYWDCSRPTAHRKLKALRDSGLIKLIKKGNMNKANLYEINNPNT